MSGSQIYDYDGPPRVCHDGHVYYDADVMRESYDLPKFPNREAVRDRLEDPLDVIISGGSMGGLFAAVSLSQAGHEPTIYEQTERGKMKERGAGIIAHPEMLAFLESQGIVEWDETTSHTSRTHHLGREGEPVDVEGRATYTSAWDTVYRNLRRALLDDIYQMGREIVKVDQTGGGVRAHFADGDVVEGDLLVCAEGYRSSTRRQYLPGRTPEYAGYVAYRGTIHEETVPPRYRKRFGEIYNLYHASESQFLTYPVPGPDGETERGERRINWVWYVPFADNALEDLLLDKDGRQRTHSLPPGLMREEIRQRQIETAGELLPPQLEWLVRQTMEPFVQCIYDLTIPQMVFDRVCVLGDAAFFIRPHMAAGTAHAAADALELGERLWSHDIGSDGWTADDLDTALAKWEASQVEMGYRLVEEARRRGDRYTGQF
ncbi:FAD-dependent monooxygenase [Haloarcula sp. JP-L23]|uniref:FAD binding domain-containing protein n=1 Tax=Haloarcula sp. JP-L23 TaxID=2716717 RepID=UPI00140EFF65|nr:FAD-dependent monooxygenase [Haloarcula sp. JP-L23]